MSRFDILDTPLAGLMVLQRKPIGDHRGFLERLFCVEDLHSLLFEQRIMQINHTLTTQQGTVRGLHFQMPPHAEIKFVSCLRGKVFDVAVDIRQGSSTFLEWHAEMLSADNHRTLMIPQGFAHGFQALTDDCQMLYFHTALYQSAAEAGLHVLDPMIGIRWPLPIVDLSTRDASHAPLAHDFDGVAI